MQTENFKHTDITEKIIKAYYKIYNTLGYGFLEKVYENTLFIELRNLDLYVEKQRRVKVFQQELPAILKKIKIYISIIFLILNFSCKTDNKTDLKKLAELDAQKTTELITQILMDENKNFLSSTCITEKPRAISQPIVSNFDNYVKKHLHIKDTVHFKLQKSLYRKFKITADLVPNKNILTQKQFEDFEKKSENGEFRFWDWLDENCKNGFCSISKPIFNKTFDLAYVQIGTICGSLCGGGEERIYEYVYGKWIEKESLSSWKS